MKVTDVQAAGAPTVHVLLAVHNRRQLTKAFLNCLRSQSYPRLRLLVVDDGSDDGTAEMVHQEYPGAVVLHGTGSLWWAGSLQLAFEQLQRDGIDDSDIVLIANDDTSFDEMFVERAARFLQAHPGSLLCARVIDPQTGEVREAGVHADFLRFQFRTARRAEEINCLPTRGLFLRWSDMRHIGGFHPFLLPHYWSDYEYTMRAFRKGYRCLTDASVSLRPTPEASGYHDLDRLVGWRFFERFFSVKSPLNPWYRSVFVCLAAPGVIKLIGLAHVWGRALPRLVWQGLARRPFPRAGLKPSGNGVA